MESLNFMNLEFTSVLWQYLLPLVLIVLDVLTGLIIAWRDNNFKSAKMRQGLSKKFGEIVYIIIGALVKVACNTNILLIFVVGYIVIMEIGSLLENCDKLGVPIPEKIKEKLNNEEE